MSRSNPSCPVHAALSLLAVVGVVACSTVLGFQDRDPADVPSDPADASTDAAADAPGEGEAGCDDIMTSSANCGRCGHDCLGGECKQGVCQPTKLLDGLVNPSDLAVNDTHLYVAEFALEGRVRRVLKSGGGEEVVAQASWVQNTCSLALDATSVFFGTCQSGLETPGYIDQCPLGGCVGMSSWHVECSYPFALLREGPDKLYWSEPVRYRIMVTVPGAEAGAETPLYPSYPGTAPKRLVAAQGSLYVQDSDARSVYRSSLEGSAWETIAEEESSACGLAANDDSLYWLIEPVVGSKTQVWRWPIGGRAGSDAVALGQNANAPVDIAADPQRVYWLAVDPVEVEAAGLVLACPAHGTFTNAEALAQSDSRPTRIIVDDKAIYWASRGSFNVAKQGTVWKLAKP